MTISDGAVFASGELDFVAEGIRLLPNPAYTFGRGGAVCQECDGILPLSELARHVTRQEVAQGHDAVRIDLRWNANEAARFFATKSTKSICGLFSGTVADWSMKPKDGLVFNFGSLTLPVGRG